MQKSKIISYKQAVALTKELKSKGKKIIFKSGCYDIFHIGHARSLARIKKDADILIVGVGTDSTLRELKGPDRPIFPEYYRAELISYLEIVDYVVILQEPLKDRIDHEKFLSLVRPDFYSLPPTDKALSVKRQMAKKYGIKIKLKAEIKNWKTGVLISSTALLNRLKQWG